MQKVLSLHIQTILKQLCATKRFILQSILKKVGKYLRKAEVSKFMFNCPYTEQLRGNSRHLSDADVIENVAMWVPVRKHGDLRRTAGMLQSVFHS